MERSAPLDPRKQLVLKAVVSDYTETAVPVGSHALAATQLASWSSATIRNDLAHLVEVGYLLQPHTSAGRVPSDRGYRYFVDFLMEEDLPAPVHRDMDRYFTAVAPDVDAVLEAAAFALAVSTESVSLVSGPVAVLAKVKHIDLVSLDPRNVLLILVLEGNLVRQQAITLSCEATQEQLSDLASILNREILSLDSAGVAAIRTLGATTSALRDEVLASVEEFMRAVDDRQGTVVIHDGVRNLVRQPEFGDVERLQQVLDVLEQERVLGGLLTALGHETGVQIVIGAENQLEQLRTCSLVLTTYRAGNSRYGTIGVLGSTRMRYGQVAPRVRYVSERLGEVLARVLG